MSNPKAHASLQWASRPELAIVALMAMVIAMLVVPLPTFMVDLFIGMNMAIAVMIFLSSFYIERILQFSTFPSILLFTTLFRLALSISTSRLILLDADAGHIVEAFGSYVIGDNLAVGLVIFLIVTVVQFIVITKGSERVGEVAARFSLDGMPGKQMSIDADLKAGTIDAAAARQRRSDVERESQLYGSFDGAMKFVKGDAVAGIVILLVNLIGGIWVGVSQHEMSFDAALRTFTLLTIGDGLVAQIPALLVCTGAGFVVTRVSGASKNLGEAIVSELFSSSPVLAISAVLVVIIGFVPGFPLYVFSALGCALGSVWWYQHRRIPPERARNSGADESSHYVGSAGEDADHIGQMINETMPLIVVFPDEHVQAWATHGWSARAASEFFLRYGMRLPQMVVRRSSAGADDTVAVWVNEIPAVSGTVHSGYHRVLSRSDELAGFDIGLKTSMEKDGAMSVWAPPESHAQLLQMGCTLRSDFEEIFRLVADAVLRNVHELFGVQETKNMLDDFEKKYPELIKEAYRHMPMQRLAEVFQRLLREGVSIRNMKVVLEALAQWASREKDVIMLVEHARTALARFITASYARDGRISAVVLSPAVEDIFRRGIRQSQGAAFLNLEPAQAEDMLDRVCLGMADAADAKHELLLLTAPDIRRFVKRFVEAKLPDLNVISYGEIADTVSIDVMRSI